MYFEYRGCFASRWISTRRVFCILSRVTTPTTVRRWDRSVSAAGVLVSVAMVPQPRSVLRPGRRGRRLLDLPLPLDRLDPGDVPAGLLHHARRLQPVGRRLEPQVEQR